MTDDSIAGGGNLRMRLSAVCNGETVLAAARFCEFMTSFMLWLEISETTVYIRHEYVSTSQGCSTKL